MDLPSWSSPIELECRADGLKSDSQIILWSTQQDLNDSQKAVFLWDQGFPQQKLWILRNWATILQDELGQDLFKQVIVILTQLSIQDSPQDFQLACSQGVHQAISKSALPSPLHPRVMDLTLSLLSYYSKILHTHWLPVFSQLLPLLSDQQIFQRVLPDVLLFGDIGQRDISRRMAAKLLNKIAEQVEGRLPNSILSKAKSLSQDTSPKVRAQISYFWGSILRKTQKVKEQAYIELLRLMKDQDLKVRKSGISSYIQVFQVVRTHPDTKSVLQNVVVPECQTWFDLTGILIEKCYFFVPEECSQLIDSMLNYSFQSRKALAWIMPCVFSVIKTTEHHIDLIKSLVTREPPIKYTIAAGLLELVKQSPNKYLRILAVKFLQDQSTIQLIVSNLKIWVSHISPQTILSSIIEKFEQFPWRLQAQVFRDLSVCLDCFGSEQMLNDLVPLVLHKMLQGSPVIRQQSSKLMVQIVHKTHITNRKYSICNIIKEKFASSKTFKGRIAFLSFLSCLVKVASASFVDSLFVQDIFNLAGDSVNQVRLFLGQILPDLIYYLYSTSQNTLSSVIQALLNDSVMQICYLAQSASQTINSVQFLSKISSRQYLQQQQARLQFEKSQVNLSLQEEQTKKKRETQEIGRIPEKRRKQGKMKPKSPKAATRSHIDAPQLRTGKSASVIKLTPSRKK